MWRFIKTLHEKSRTLQFRLTAWNTFVVALVVSITLMGIYQAVRLFMLGEFDKLLAEDIVEIKLTIKQLYPDWKRLENELNRKAQGHVHHLWFVQLFDDNGKLLWACYDAPEITLPIKLDKSARIYSNEAPFRFAQARFEEPGIPPMFIRVGSSREPVMQELALLGRIKVIGGIVAVFLAPFGGYWLASRAIRPIARIIATTAKLHPSNLNERLRIRHTGDEVDQLSVTINGMLDRIASYLKQNRDFVANAAHELRSPLAAIHSSVEVALNGRRSQEEYSQLLADVMEECAALERLVNRLLVLAESDAGLGLNGQLVRLDELVKKSVDMFRGVAESQGLLLTSSELAAVQVRGQETYLRQVVQNLIDNAIKFTPAGGSVTVAVHDDADHGRAVLTVSDTGIGIAADDMPRVFQRFYRGDKSRYRDAGMRGSGLGLSICHSIVHALKGEIQLESQPGKGTRFTVTLPSHR
jgi:signal transduction histidine kinase